MANVIESQGPARVPTSQLLNAWADARDRHAEVAGRPSRELDDAVQVLEDARDPLLARIQELERDRDLLERLARMDSITLGSRTGSPLRKWERPRLLSTAAAALRGFLATLPAVTP